MFSRRGEPIKPTKKIATDLKKLYKNYLRKFEEKFQFHEFHDSPIDEAYFESKATVLLIGQYSVGKSTFIKHLLDEKPSGMNIGPEPTTDGFMVIYDNGCDKKTCTPGNTMVADRTMPFKDLEKFGSGFLQKFGGSSMKFSNERLEDVMLIDTPGILSGRKQTDDRGYDFAKVVEWFSKRVDSIILLFDAHKLDINNEYEETIRILKPYADKVKIVLNKADGVSKQALYNVQGSLMFNLGKVLNTPETPKVIKGSFWDEPYQNSENRDIFEEDKEALNNHLYELYGESNLRKYEDLERRYRDVELHAIIISEISDRAPSLTAFNKEKKQREMVNNLSTIFTEIGLKYENKVHISDLMKNLSTYEKKLSQKVGQPWRKFKKLDLKELENLKYNVRHRDGGLNQILSEIKRVRNNFSELDSPSAQLSRESVPEVVNPFNSINATKGVDAGMGGDVWEPEKIGTHFVECEKITDGRKMTYGEYFEAKKQNDKRISGADMKNLMTYESKLPNQSLGKIWKLSDVNGIGTLDAEEYLLCLHLMKIKLANHELPKTLPEHLRPPSTKHVNQKNSQQNLLRSKSDKSVTSGLSPMVGDLIKIHDERGY
jgi:GTP-binding protein EngB required for normal cell division